MQKNFMVNHSGSKLNTEVVFDASPCTFFVILTQNCDNENKKRVVACASRSLTEILKRYSQIEREALVILFDCTKCQGIFWENILK